MSKRKMHYTAEKSVFAGDQVESIKRRMDKNQEAFYNGTKKKRVSIVDAKAGTGKTTLSFVSGLEYLGSGAEGINKLIYIRFPDEQVQSLGFLPGDINEKGSLYFGPAYTTLVKCGMQPEMIDRLRLRGTFEFIMANTMRGSDYENAFVIIDECQNAPSISALQTVLTRFHDNCKIMLVGHSKQQDNDVKLYSGHTPFQAYQKHLLKKEWTQRFELIVDYRGELCRWSDDIDKTLEDLRKEE